MAAGAARIVYVGHATVLVEMEGVRLLTDPLLRPRILHLRRSGTIAVAALDEVDAVLISHLHFDHLDLRSLQQLGRDVRVVVPRGAGEILERKGFTSVTELAVGEELRVGSLAIRTTPALHDARRGLAGRRAEPMGYVIDGSRSVYFAGDTDLFDGMAALGPIDIALVPIWGWGPSLGPGHLNPRTAAEAVRRTGATTAIPIHWGTLFPLQTRLRGLPLFLETPAEEFQAHMREVAPHVEVRTLHPGQETVIDKPRAGSN
jgi:L-ascorbate metabolism protein UlaG (beta-lactamase superfamily)